MSEVEIKQIGKAMSEIREGGKKYGVASGA